jgi:hypothetical protein
VVTKDIDVSTVDLSEFKQGATKSRSSRVCRVPFLELTNEQREKFEAACKRPDISDNAIRMVLEDWGFPIPQHNFTKHRSGKCGCNE